MKVQHIVGADISKKSIDLVCHLTCQHTRIENTSTGYIQMVKWLKQQKVDTASLLVVMEHTGLYSLRFEKFLHKQQVAFTKVNALAIKRSIGLVRGKNDKIDARRIAAYGYEKREQLVAEAQISPIIERLQMLRSTRLRLVKQRAMLLCAIREYKAVGLSKQDILMQVQLQLIKEFTKQVKRIETEVQALINSDEVIARNYNLLLTIKGVGKETALATILKTRNFTRINDGRKFACYSGTAPFDHTSGTSIKGKTRVSHLADKQMKTLLDQGAKTAIQYDKELRSYYLRRLEMGKSKMSTINIVRNKIIYRMFAVIKRQTPFVENYLKAA
jgi:transposase